LDKKRRNTRNMKKIILILAGLLMTATLMCQTTIYNNLVIQKTTPLFHLNGNGGTISFYNGDIVLAQSSNTLTLSGGNFALGANNIYLNGQIGQTGSRVSKIWTTDLELTNAPTIGGVSFMSTFAPINNPTFLGTVSLPITTSIGSVSSTELGYLNNTTSEIQAQINSKLPISNPTPLGNVTLPSTTTIDGSTVPEMIADTMNQVRSDAYELNVLSPLWSDTATVVATKTDLLNIEAGGGTAGQFSVLSGITGVTDGFPEAGDSLIIHTNFIGRYPIVFREGAFQQKHVDNTTTDGYRFNSTTGTLTFRPVFADNEQVEVWGTNTILFQALVPEGGSGGGGDPTPPSLLTDLMAGWHLDEVGGTAFADVVGDNDGVSTALLGASGKFGLGQSFTSTTAYSRVVYDATMDVTGLDELTVSLWVKFSSVSIADGMNLFYLSTSDANYWSILIRVDADDALVFYAKNSDATVYDAQTADDAFVIDTWYNIICTVNGTGNPLEIYIDGADAVSSADNFSGNLLPFNQYIHIGSGSSSDVSYTRGTIDEPYMWSRPLTGDERTLLQTLVYPFNE
jgi:hypothetical protein